MIEMYANWEENSIEGKFKYYNVLRIVRFMIQLGMLNDVYFVDTKDHSKRIKIKPWLI